MKRRGKMIIGLIVLALVAGYVIGAWVTSGMILHPARRGLQEAAEAYGYATPADFRRPYADMQVFVGKETIRGWLVRAEPSSRRAVLLIHGLGENRVGMLPLLPVVEPLGVNVALIDLRAHGESDGACLTYGVREREDVKAVIDWLIDRDLAQPGAVALVGWSMGGAVSIQTAAIDERVGAVVADAAFARLRPMIYREARRIFPPSVLCAPLGIWWAERRGDFSVRDAAPVSLADRVRCPVLLIHGEADDVVPVRHASELRSALGENAEVWIVPGAGHCDALAADEVIYTQRVRAFLRAHLTR